MKTKFYLIAAVAILISACSNQDAFDDGANLPANNHVSSIRSYEEALAIAQASIPMLDNSSVGTRSTDIQRKIDLSEKKVFKLGAKTRTNESINDTLIYVFNFENNEGFAMVSAAKNTEGLLAIVEQGHCDPDTPSEVEGFEMFKDMAKEYVRRALEQKEPEPLRIVELKDSITYSFSQVGPYVTVKWGQHYPEGEFCSNCTSGCTNTAMAQIMSYYNYPTSIALTYEGLNYLSLNWSNMKAHATGHSLSSCSTQNTHIMIGKLLRELGHRNNSTYHTNNLTTTSTMTYAGPTFSNLGYTIGSWDNFSDASVRSQLNSAHLILMRGLKDTGSGHAWVLDGYKTRVTTIRQMAWTAATGWYFTGTVTTLTDYFMHFNWGWYGDCNGYFAVGVYNTTQAFSYDPGTSQGHNSNYNNSVKYLSVYH